MKLILLLFLSVLSAESLYVPVRAGNRRDASLIRLTEIGAYGLVRKARTTVPAHLHTGIDIRRPGSNYDNEPVYPLMKGKVISRRTDGPYAQLIIEHQLKGLKFWTLYEHIAGICVKPGELVSPGKPVARFMNKAELNRHGWQFNHFHLEVLKTAPFVQQPDKLRPDRHFSAATLICYKKEDLEKYYYDPLEFIRKHL